MYKYASIAAACALGLSGAAHAEGAPIKVTIEYDRALLSSETGLEAVRLSISQQARKACMTRGPLVSLAIAPKLDQDCAADVFAGAIAGIEAREGVTLVASDTDTALQFARAD